MNLKYKVMNETSYFVTIYLNKKACTARNGNCSIMYYTRQLKFRKIMLEKFGLNNNDKIV